jgi:hypothetical protein
MPLTAGTSFVCSPPLYAFAHSLGRAIAQFHEKKMGRSFAHLYKKNLNRLEKDG